MKLHTLTIHMISAFNMSMSHSIWSYNRLTTRKMKHSDSIFFPSYLDAKQIQTPL